MEHLIKNVTIVDGTGTSPYIGDVGISKGKIVLNPKETAENTIDGTGLHLTPGFIDAHSHNDFILTKELGPYTKLSQGITTEIVAQCGVSLAPSSEKYFPLLLGLLSTQNIPQIPEMQQWTTIEKYLDFIDTLPLYTNMKTYVAQGILRLAVMGLENRPATEKELEEMKELLANAMEHGALGISSGLVYPPGSFTPKEELIELAKVIQPYGGIYATHMRDESNFVVEAVKEAIDIGRQSGVTVQISHHKVLGRQNWGKHKETLKLIDDANKEGIAVHFDQYPYTRNMTSLSVVIPPEYFDIGNEALAKKLNDKGFRAKLKAEMTDPDNPYDNYYLSAGGWSGVYVLASGNRDAVGLSIKEYADKIDKDPFDAFFDLMEDYDLGGTACFDTMRQEDLFDIISSPYAMTGTDGITTSLEYPCHPRTFGTFPRAIIQYTRENSVLSLEEMIRKMTSLPAEVFSLDNKGIIENGYDADLVLLDYKNLEDTATYTDSNQITKGINAVFVNGEIAFANGELQKANGSLLRHNIRR